MIAPPGNTQIWIAAGVTDLRRGFTGLSALVQTKLEKSPMSGQVFIFRGRRGDLVKLIWFDGDGEGAENRLAAMCGIDAAAYGRERPGMSAFVLEDGVVYHAYSTYARGVDSFFGVYHWLDRAPKGRNETGVWWHRHDEYGKG
jgi:predicted dithiol-disulfide oxidoreductase (DUF899 family)